MQLTFEHLHETNTARSIEWMGKKPTIEDMLFCAVELGGESGEVLNAVKKLSRTLQGVKGGVSMEVSLKAIAEELADVVICTDRVASALNINLAKAVVNKFNATSDKNGLTTKFDIKPPIRNDSIRLEWLNTLFTDPLTDEACEQALRFGTILAGCKDFRLAIDAAMHLDSVNAV